MGITEIDFLDPSGCLSLGAAFSDPDRAWRDCLGPRPRTRAILGMPRPGGVYLPRPSFDERGKGHDRGWHVVRVIKEYISEGNEGGIPPSRHFVAYDYVVEAAPGGGWVFVKKEPLFYLEL